MNIYELCGYVSGFLFALSLVPQVYKSYKTQILTSCATDKLFDKSTQKISAPPTLSVDVICKTLSFFKLFYVNLSP